MTKKVAIVIPAWNEAERLPAVLASLENLAHAIIVVDDGSTDNTFETARTAGVIALRHIVNRFQGAALRTGTVHAIEQGHDIIVHFDADGQFRGEDIANIIAPLISGTADIVFGSRFMDDSTKMPVFKKNFIMPLARAVNYLAYGIRLTDPQSGFRAFTASSYDKIKWQQDGMAHCSEILHLAHKHNLRIVEVPITVRYHEFGQKLSGGFRIIKELILARFLN